VINRQAHLLKRSSAPRGSRQSLSSSSKRLARGRRCSVRPPGRPPAVLRLFVRAPRLPVVASVPMLLIKCSVSVKPKPPRSAPPTSRRASWRRPSRSVVSSQASPTMPTLGPARASSPGGSRSLRVTHPQGMIRRSPTSRHQDWASPAPRRPGPAASASQRTPIAPNATPASRPPIARSDRSRDGAACRRW